jgi:hypothetical protein
VKPKFIAASTSPGVIAGFYTYLEDIKLVPYLPLPLGEG